MISTSVFRLVLDASAVTAYAAGSIHLGEVLAEAADERGTLIALPYPALVLAVAGGADGHAITPLPHLPHVEIVDEWDRGWHRMGAATALLGTLDRAWAALMIDDGRAELVLTADPDAYGGIETIQI